MKHNEYQCEDCHGIFEKGQSDEAADNEYESAFPGFPIDDRGMVCDDCYQKYFAKPTGG